MSSFNRYYLDELVSLRELGREYSRANPSLAPLFDTPGRDPDVERILEGVAFLCGRLRQKLDDELPEITHSLFSLLWPNYLRTIPSCSIVRYEPAANLSWAVTIPRGTMVESVEVEGTKCRFQTVYENQVLPVRLAEQTIFEHDGQIILSLRFGLVGSTLENIPLSRLRLFFTGEPAIAHSMYFTIMHHVREIRFLLPDGKGGHAPVHVLSPQMICPVGFREDEGLFPYPANTFPGYRIIQEYFCFIEKFLFVEISGLDACVKAGLEAAAGAEEFALHFVLTEFPEQYESWRRDNIQLFCTPVVNLFPMDSTPLNIDHRQQEYRIVPDPRLPYHYAVYSVDDVRSWGGNGKHRREYRAFESFEHGTSPEADTAYYRLRLKPSLRDESTETYISIVHSPASAASLGEEVISLELTCTNRLLPGRLVVGDINTHADDTPDTVTLGNITPVTPSYTPPLEGDLLWRLISNMSLNYLPLNNVHAMRALIASYDFRALRDRYRSRVLDKMLGGMTQIVSEETDRIYQGLPVRGTVTRLTLDRDGFSCEGEMFLFASVINEFLALYATVNSFHQLIVIDAGRTEEYQWPARLGRRLIP
jgi:type VI secretion system protein ImpG